MHRKKRAGLLALVLILGIVFSACATPQKEEEAEKPIQIALTQDILSFDPMLTSDIFSEAVLRCVYTSLYDFDEEMNLRPRLAKKATMRDELTWEIEIQSGVTFHDGSPLTAEDVVFTFTRAISGGRTEKLLEMVEDVVQLDDTRLLINLKEPYPMLQTLFAKAETSIVSKKVVEAEGYDFTMPVGAGPFQLRAWEENSKISLERYEDCYLGKAASQYLDFLVIVTEQDRTTAFLNGEVDLLFSVSAYDCDKLSLSEGVKLLVTPSTKIEYLSLNTQHTPFTDPKVRLAVSHAINRQNIVDGVYHGYCTPSSSLIPKGVTGYLDTPVDYDPDRAKALLKEAGYADGFSFDVITINTIRKNTLEYIRLDLAAVGIALNYNLVTMKEAVDLMNAGEHDSILVGWAFNSDPNSVLPVLLGTGSGKTMNSSNYANPVVDALLAKGRAEKDEGKRKEIYEEVNQVVSQEAPIVVLGNPMILSAARSDITGVHFNAQGLMQYESLKRE